MLIEGGGKKVASGGLRSEDVVTFMRMHLKI